MALRQHVFLSNQQDAERSQQVQSVVVLSKTAMADLAIAEHMLAGPEEILDLGSNAGFDFLGFQFFGIKFLPTARAFGKKPRDVLAAPVLIPLVNTKLTGINEDSLLFTMQKFVGGNDVVDIDDGGVDATNQAQSAVDTNLHLHAEVQFVALYGLEHLTRSDDSVAFASLVIDRDGSRDSVTIP